MRKHSITSNNIKIIPQSERNDSFKCEHCVVKCMHHKGLVEHRRRVHGIFVKKNNERTRYYEKLSAEERQQLLWDEKGCKDCNKLFSYRRMLVGHMDLIHDVQIEPEFHVSH